MSNLETRLADWRARMAKVLPQSEAALDELEEHLRERVAELESHGTSEDDAFAIAQAGIGEPHVIAREFDRIPGRWRPGLISLPALALILAFFYGQYLWNWPKHWPGTALHLVALATYTIVFLGIIGAGLIATGAFMKTLRRPLGERERYAVRRLLGNLAWVAAVCVLAGWALNAIWLIQYGYGGARWPFHVRYGGALVSVVLLILALSRRNVSDRGRWFMAILPSLVVIFLNLWLMRVADVSIAWVCVAFLLGQVFYVLPRFRIRIERLHEPLR